MRSTPYDIISWDDAPLHPLRAYKCYDVDGTEVIINPKNPANHSIGHPLESESAIFANLRFVVSQPDKSELSTSNNPKAIESRQKGKIVVYSSSNLINKISFPGQDGLTGNVEVVVMYPYDGTTPYSKTYLVNPSR